MARSRVRATVRKARRSEAQLVGQGVFSVAVDLQGRTMALPIFVTAPLIYAAEMIATKLCRDRGWTGEGQQEAVAEYLFVGLQDVAVALAGGFDEQHFDAWAAARRQREAASG